MSARIFSQKRPADKILERKKRLGSADDLCTEGLINAADVDGIRAVGARYDIGISEHVRGNMEQMVRGGADALDNPVARQYVPRIEELDVKCDEESDPIGDEVYSPVRGVVHRYPDRVLLKASNVCAVYCRYCFRREMVGAGTEHLSDDDLEGALSYIQSHPEIWEVILTGGDPLVLSARRLQRIIDALNRVKHVQIIRVHTRMPVSNPEKIDDTILRVLKSSAVAVHVVLHVNHVLELSEQVRGAIVRLRGAGCSVLSQSVLLRGVNDSAQALENLFRALVCLHVQPYYLHHLDRAKGTSHFRVSLKRGQEIMKDLQGRVSGMCLPKYMLDIPGGDGKIPVHGGYVRAMDEHSYYVEDYQGCEHLYQDYDPRDVKSVDAEKEEQGG